MTPGVERVPDHPVIRNMELTGYPDGRAPREPVCPVCGRVCEVVYRNRDREIVGCDDCLKIIDAEDVPECFPEE